MEQPAAARHVVVAITGSQADIGHFESELPVLPLIQGLIAKTKVEVIIAKEEKPWVMV